MFRYKFCLNCPTGSVKDDANVKKIETVDGQQTIRKAHLTSVGNKFNTVQQQQITDSE